MYDFESDLNKFQDQIMSRWFDKTSGHQRIGLSIQLFGSVQNDDSKTREKKTHSYPNLNGHFRNDYCKTIYSQPDKLIKCNMLDQITKNKLGTNKYECIACRCHMGISNLLFPFVHPLNNDLIWYIFIGQMIVLKPKTDEAFAVARHIFNMQAIKDAYTFGYNDTEKLYVYPNIFLDEEEDKKIFNEIGELNISKINYVDLLRFKEYVTGSFEIFLNYAYGDPKKKQKMEEYIALENDNIERLILFLQNDFSRVLGRAQNLNFQENNSVAKSLQAMVDTLKQGKKEKLYYINTSNTLKKLIEEQNDKVFISLLLNFVEKHPPFLDPIYGIKSGA